MPEETLLRFPFPFGGITQMFEANGEQMLERAINALRFCGHLHTFAVEMDYEGHRLWVSESGAKCLRAALDPSGLTWRSMSPHDRGEWVLDQQVIMKFLPDKKILAIKETRALTGMGLKEAKDAVEMAQWLAAQGHMSRTERETVDREAQEIVNQLTGKPRNES